MSNDISYTVIVISKDRPEVLRETLRSVHRQSAPANTVLVIVDKTEDFLPDPEMNPKIQILFHSGSSSAKRNFAAHHAPRSSDLLLFLDDDMELQREYARETLTFFLDRPDLIAASGNALADCWMARSEAISLCKNTPPPAAILRTSGAHSILYGCNMAIRREAFLREMFDEALPLYSFGEDYEISMRLRRHGQVGRMSCSQFVHLRAPQGRLSRNRYIYSVLANNWYFIGKRSIHCSLPVSYLRFLWIVWTMAWREFRQGGAKDVPSSGLQGVSRALRDLVAGRLHPSRLNDL